MTHHDAAEARAGALGCRAAQGARRWLGRAGVLAALLAARRAAKDLGATRAEARGPMPGDGVLGDADPALQSTMATTLPGPPAAVWPWLVQMGCDRAGWYSIDRFDNAGRPSLRWLMPHWQHLDVGDRLASTPSGRVWFEVVDVVPERHLVLRVSLDLVTMRPYDARGPRPRAWQDATWAFELRPAGDARTRLVTRSRAVASHRWLARLSDWVVWRPAHLVMQTAQFRNLRRRLRASPAPGDEEVAA